MSEQGKGTSMKERLERCEGFLALLYEACQVFDQAYLELQRIQDDEEIGVNRRVLSIGSADRHVVLTHLHFSMLHEAMNAIPDELIDYALLKYSPASDAEDPEHYVSIPRPSNAIEAQSMVSAGLRYLDGRP